MHFPLIWRLRARFPTQATVLNAASCGTARFCLGDEVIFRPTASSPRIRAQDDHQSRQSHRSKHVMNQLWRNSTIVPQFKASGFRQCAPWQTQHADAVPTQHAARRLGFHALLLAAEGHAQPGMSNRLLMFSGSALTQQLALLKISPRHVSRYTWRNFPSPAAVSSVSNGLKKVAHGNALSCE